MKLLIGMAFSVVNEKKSVRIDEMILVENWNVMMFSGLPHRSRASLLGNIEHRVTVLHLYSIVDTFGMYRAPPGHEIILGWPQAGQSTCSACSVNTSGGTSPHALNGSLHFVHLDSLSTPHRHSTH
jgi:hypothetical protein